MIWAVPTLSRQPFFMMVRLATCVEGEKMTRLATLVGTRLGDVCVGQDWLLRSRRLLRLTPILDGPLMGCTKLSKKRHTRERALFIRYPMLDASIGMG